MEKNSGHMLVNMGMGIAVGDYVICDSDDWNHPDRITNCIKYLSRMMQTS